MKRLCKVAHEKPLGEGRFKFFIRGAVYNSYDFDFELGDLFFIDAPDDEEGVQEKRRTTKIKDKNSKEVNDGDN